MRIKDILLSGWITLMACLPIVNSRAVEVIISDGMSNAQLKQRMEQSLSNLLTEVNAAYEGERNINYGALRLPSDVQT